MDLELSESEIKTLKLLEKKEGTEATVKKKTSISSKDLENLVSKRYLEAYKKPRGKVFYYKMTDLGNKIVQQFPQLEPPKKAPARGKKSINLGIIEQYYEKLDKKMDLILDYLMKISPKVDMNDNTQLSLNDFQHKLKKMWSEINQEYRKGGRVEIPTLRSRININRKLFDKYLFELEKDRIIDLQIASDPKFVPNADQGINHPSRGLIYYVIWRN